uniref:Uncharacterized protein n=1 Tax=Physcomitrium patens TaxID=3218 RepID=A9SC38_PHYPA|nr:hypothetical protein PHYPA_007456 [Physcomitrium patens]
MAVVLRNVAAFGRLACSPAVDARVWCGIEPSKPPKTNGSVFQDQESSLSKSKSSVSHSQSVNNPARCQASVTAYPPPTRQSVGVLERPVVEEKPTPELRPDTIDQHAEPLPRSFLAESVNGTLVECNGKGSRPLYTNVLTELQLSYLGTSSTEVRAPVDNEAVKMAFEAALENAPGNARIVSEYAMFTWKTLGDIDAAEMLYNKALELAPHDADIQASHALFLWQCDE